MTVSCARCHDHKFDPVPQADYYSLHGIFASSVEPLVKPMISDPKADPNYQDYLAKRSDLDARIQNVRTQSVASVFGEYKRLTAFYLYATQMPVKEREAYLSKTGGDADLLKNWQQITRGGGRQAASIFGLWNAMAKISEARFSVQAPRMIANFGRNEKARELNPQVLEAFKGTAPRTLAEVAAVSATCLRKTIPQPSDTFGLLVMRRCAAPNRQRAQFFGLRERSDMLELMHPGSPARAPHRQPTPKDSPIFVR